MLACPMIPAPRAPLENTPPHLVVRPYGDDAPCAIYCWVSADPAVFMTQTIAESFDIIVARAFVHATEVMLQAFPDVTAAEKTVVLHDFANVQWFPPDGRAYLQEQARTQLKDLKMSAQYASSSVNTLTHMALRMMSVIVRAVTGTPLRVVRPTEFAERVQELWVAPEGRDERLDRCQQLVDAVDYSITDPAADRARRAAPRAPPDQHP